jgi:hypothetical protein
LNFGQEVEEAGSLDQMVPEVVVTGTISDGDMPRRQLAACRRPVGWYLPENWAADAARRHKTRVFQEVGFKTKVQAG